MTQYQTFLMFQYWNKMKKLLLKGAMEEQLAMCDNPSNLVVSMDSEHSFIRTILKGMPEMSDPIEIMKYLQQQVVTGHLLETSSTKADISGESNYVTVDRANIFKITESLRNHYEYDSDYGWRSIEPSAHALVVIPLSLSD